MVLEPGEVVEVGAVRDRHDLALRLRAPRVSSAIASESATIASACDATSATDVRRRLLLQPRELRLVAAPVRMRRKRVAQVGDPAHAPVARFTAAPRR